MRWLVASVVFLAACGGKNGVNPDASVADSVSADAVPADAAFCPAIAALDPAALSELVVTGDSPAAGIFDPSTVYPADATTGVMAYSAVPDQLTIRTHIAGSSDHGVTWTLAAEANTPEVVSEPCATGTCSGKLISETPSLIYDADDPDPSKRWKLFAARYLVAPGTMGPLTEYDIGTIALQTAAQPQGPWSAPGKLLGWNGQSSYSSTSVVTNISALPGMTDCKFLSEPAALWLPGTIDLAVGCVFGTDYTGIRIELVRSTDHGAHWTHVSTLLQASDAGCGNVSQGLNGANLFALNGTEYVAASPSNPVGYRGCLVFTVEDIATGKIHRDSTGRAIVDRAMSANQFNGACDFAPGGSGYTLDVGFFTDARPFRIYRAGVTSP